MKNVQPCILNDNWLLQCISRFEEQGKSHEQLIDFVNQWESAACKYLDWLQNEGFDLTRSLTIINAALKRSNFDLSKFPICNAFE